MRLSIAKVWLILALLVVAISCASDGGYAAASIEYDTTSQAYVNAGNEVKAAEANLTADQRTRFRQIQAEVQAADLPVYDALRTWKTSGKKPDGYDSLFAALTAAQSRMLTLAYEVRR